MKNFIVLLLIPFALISQNIKIPVDTIVKTNHQSKEKQ